MYKYYNYIVIKFYVEKNFTEPSVALSDRSRRGETDLESEMRIVVVRSWLARSQAKSGQPWLKVDEGSTYRPEFGRLFTLYHYIRSVVEKCYTIFRNNDFRTTIINNNNRVRSEILFFSSSFSSCFQFRVFDLKRINNKKIAIKIYE